MDFFANRKTPSQYKNVMRSASRSIATRLALVIAFAFNVGSQEIPGNDDEVKRISSLIDQAGKAVKASSGASRSDEGRKYSAILWQYHSDHPNTPAGSRAVVAALNIVMPHDLSPRSWQSFSILGNDRRPRPLSSRPLPAMRKQRAFVRPRLL